MSYIYTTFSGITYISEIVGDKVTWLYVLDTDGGTYVL